MKMMIIMECGDHLQFKGCCDPNCGIRNGMVSFGMEWVRYMFHVPHGLINECIANFEILFQMVNQFFSFTICKRSKSLPSGKKQNISKTIYFNLTKKKKAIFFSVRVKPAPAKCYEVHHTQYTMFSV